MDVTISNSKLPLDQNGNKIITGEAGVLAHDGAYYFYFNDWGTCPGVDCCDSSGGCASCCQTNPPHPLSPGCTNATNGSNPYGLFHQFVAYKTTDFMTWTYLGISLPLSARAPGETMRPHVIYNNATNLFVLWYEDRPETGYAVATSSTAAGPFVTIATNVKMPGRGRIGDFDLFVDDDGIAYHIRTGLTVVQLSADFTSPTTLMSEIPTTNEAPVMFKRKNMYYAMTGKDCCYCLGGSNNMYWSAPSLKGPWKYIGDVGSNPTPFNAHSPNNFVTKAQEQKVFTVPTPTGMDWIWLGMQWNSGLAETPPGPRHHDLWAFYKFDFNTNGTIKQLQHQDNVTFTYAP